MLRVTDLDRIQSANGRSARRCWRKAMIVPTTRPDTVSHIATAQPMYGPSTTAATMAATHSPKAHFSPLVRFAEGSGFNANRYLG